MRAQIRTIALVTLLVAGACACGGPRLEPDVWERASCARGEQAACTCAGGVPGSQVCDDASFGACMCAPGDGGSVTSQTCEPGSGVPCACAGGVPGSQRCNSAGTGFGSCVCSDR